MRTDSSITASLSVIFVMILAASSVWLPLHIPAPQITASPVTQASSNASSSDGLLGQYWSNNGFPNTPPDHTQIDANISFATTYGYNWHPFGYGSFSVKWNGTIIAPANGTYAFQLNSDDGSWLFIDGTLIINDGGGHPPQIVGGSVVLTHGPHAIGVQFFECCGGQSGVDLYWMPPGSTSFTLVPSLAFCVSCARSRIFTLNAQVTNSTGAPIPNASVSAMPMAGGTSNSSSTNAEGLATMTLSQDSYNVTASAQNYLSISQTVNMTINQNITLTLARPYVFLGEIPDSHIVIQEVNRGFNITLLNMFNRSSSDVFFDWKALGTIAPNASQTFFFDHLPNLIVEAAAVGTLDYPDAWDRQPLPIALQPMTGNGAFEAEPVPYVAQSIFVVPYPPVLSQNTTIGVILHNPTNVTIHISRVDFQLSGLTVGGFFSSIGYLSNITLPTNETNSFSIIWLATVSGHHCIRVVLTFSPTSETLQRNIDIEGGMLPGQAGQALFSLTNPEDGPATMTLVMNRARLPLLWGANVQVNGITWSGLLPLTIEMGPGETVKAVLTMTSGPFAAGTGIVDIQGFIGGQLIGGFRKVMLTSFMTGPTWSMEGPTGMPMGFETDPITISGQGWEPGSTITVKSLPFFQFSSFTTNSGSFSVTADMSNLGITPGLFRVIAVSDKGQQGTPISPCFAISAIKGACNFLYLGNAALDASVGQCMLGVAGVGGYVGGVLMSGGQMIYDYFNPPSTTILPFDITSAILSLPNEKGANGLGTSLGCLGTLVGLVSGEYHHLDLLVQTSEGNAGTTGSGDYVVQLNQSWASGNSFNDTQLIMKPFTTSFRIVVNATRAINQTESYDLFIGLAPPSEGVCSKILHGTIQRGQSITYLVNATNCSVSLKGTPTLSTTVSPSSVSIIASQSATDTAILSGGYNPQGTVTFRAYKNDSTCQSANLVFMSSPDPVTNNQSISDPFTPTSAGTYYWTAQYSGDSNNNGFMTFCNASGEILIAGSTKLAYTGPTAVDYGDSVTLSAELTDAVTGLGVSGKIVQFYFNGLQVGSGSTNGTGMARIRYTVTQQSGLASAQAKWPGDTNSLPSNTRSVSLTINKEDTMVTYTGNTVLSTTSSSFSLQALVEVDGGTEPNGPFGGILTYAMVNFTIYTTTLTPTRLGSLLVPISSVSGLMGTASITLACKAGSGSPPNSITCGGITLQEGAYYVQVEIDPKNAYFTSSTSNGIFSIFVPTGQFVTGGGWVADPSSANPKNQANFGFTVRYNKNGQVQGQSVYVYRTTCVSPAPTNDPCDVMIKSNAWIGLGFYSQTVNGVTQSCSSFQSKASVEETDTATGIVYSVQGNNQMTMNTCMGNSDSSPAGTYAMQDLSQSGPLFHATPGYPAVETLGGGSIIVHNKQFTPTISLSPNSCAPGSTVAVSGTGFAPVTNIRIMIGSIVLATTTTDSSGSFSTTFPGPSTASTYTVKASDGTNSAWAMVTVT